MAIVAAFYSFWPVMVMGLEGYNIDLGVIFAGRAIAINIGGFTVAPKTIIPTAYYYMQALGIEAYPRLVADTLLVAALSIGIALAVGIPVAYVLARIDVRGKNFISYLLLALRTVSQFVVIIPLYIAYSRFGLYDSFTGIALAEQVLILSVVVWMLRGFFSDIPRDIYEAATVFGKNEWQVFRRVSSQWSSRGRRDHHVRARTPVERVPHRRHADRSRNQDCGGGGMGRDECQPAVVQRPRVAEP